MYSIKEIFYSLQGEGAHAGRPAIFCRFTGCNLWSGREQDRARAQCRFCDTDFVGTDGHLGGKYPDAAALTETLLQLWPDADAAPYIVMTGGEPLLQLDAALIDALHQRGALIALETNGTLALPAPVDWVCVSPKGDNALKLNAGDELKLVYPQAGVNPADFAGLNFTHFFLQPCADPVAEPGTVGDAAPTVQYCLEHPQWRLSLQTHKLLGIE